MQISSALGLVGQSPSTHKMSPLFDSGVVAMQEVSSG